MSSKPNSKNVSKLSSSSKPSVYRTTKVEDGHQSDGELTEIEISSSESASSKDDDDDLTIAMRAMRLRKEDDRTLYRLIGPNSPVKVTDKWCADRLAHTRCLSLRFLGQSHTKPPLSPGALSRLSRNVSRITNERWLM